MVKLRTLKIVLKKLHLRINYRFKYIPHSVRHPVYCIIQRGNFNWNKIRNVDIGDFCKKSRNRSIFVFSCPHFGAYCFCLSAPISAQPPVFFFKCKGMSSDTSFERPLRKEYEYNKLLLPGYLQSLRAKKIKTNFIS
jgi:hypothetical protein